MGRVDHPLDATAGGTHRRCLRRSREHGPAREWHHLKRVKRARRAGLAWVIRAAFGNWRLALSGLGCGPAFVEGFDV